MYDSVVPRLGDISFFEENSFHSATAPVYDGKDWYIQGRFSVVDKLTEEYNRTKPFYKRRKGNKGGDLGHVFPFLICSPGYSKKHGKQLKEDEWKPITMESFEVSEATSIISTLIEQAGDNISIDQLWAHLAAFSDTEYDS